MAMQASPQLLTMHKTLALQCRVATSRINAIENLLYQSYPVKTRRKLNVEPAIDAIRNLKYTMENRLLRCFPRKEHYLLLGIYSGSGAFSLKFYHSINLRIHDKNNLDEHGIRIRDGQRKRHLTKTEHARVWIILQAIAGTFQGYQSTFTWAYPSDDTPYNQAGKIVARVKALQEKLQDLHIKENKEPVHDDEWQDIFNGLDHDCFFFEKALLVLQVNQDIQQEDAA